MADKPDFDSIFCAAVEIASAEDRAAYLNAVCGDDAQLRARLQRLVAAHFQAGTFLQAPAVSPNPAGLGQDATSQSSMEIAAAPGVVIGPYKLIEQIGEGGMGTVWMAQQTEPVKRVVAIKLIKAGMDSRQVIARFEAERQALALMDHPNIAKVLDGGTIKGEAQGLQPLGLGRPYFVMDLVKGIPITKYCDEHHLTPRERLELFIPVCQAVQHAHQKGIIHLDLKPSNVLVALYDGKPVPKVIDFGVAKAAGQSLTDKTLVTGFGNIVGTLEYMSPEQAEVNQLDIDTRSDIYSLGVLLYELLTGSPPFSRKELEKAGMLEMLRVIREEEPSKPSTKLSSSDALPSLSANRGTEPAKLTKLVRGELDWIVMKALEKDRNRRYETANGFAMDVQRYLADEPVLACPPSMGYRVRKIVRRNKVQVAFAVAMLLFLVLLGGGIGYTISERASRQARVAAQVEPILSETDRLMKESKWPEALAVAKRAEAALVGGDADNATQDRVQQVVRDIDLVLRLEDARLQASEVQQGELDRSGADQRFAQLFAEFGLEIENLNWPDAAERLRRHPAVAVEIASGLTAWTRIRWLLSEKQHDQRNFELLTLADQLDRDSWRSRLRAHWKQGESVDKSTLLELAAAAPIRDLPTATVVMLGNLLEDKMSPDEGAKFLRKAQVFRPGEFSINYHLARCCSNSRPASIGEAVEFSRAALAVRPTNIPALNNLAGTLTDERKFEEAAGYYRKAIELDPRYALAHSNLAFTLMKLRKLDEAVAFSRKAIELDPMSARSHAGLGIVLIEQKRLEEAVACHRKAIELDPSIAPFHNYLGVTLEKQNNLDGAITCYRKAIELDPQYAKAHTNLGRALSQKKLGEAIACHRKAIELDPSDAEAHVNLGVVLTDNGESVEAVACYRRAIELNPTSARAHNNLGGAMAKQKKFDEAVAFFRRAIDLDPTEAQFHNNLGSVLAKQKKLGEATACFRKAIDVDPTEAKAHYNLGRAFADEKRWDEAIACYLKVIELDPKHPSAHANLGVARFHQDKLDEAVAWFHKAIELDPKSALGFIGLGTAFERQGKLDEAVVYLRTAIEIDPQSLDGHLFLGGVLYKQRKLDEAITCFRTAIELDSTHSFAHNNLGRALMDLKDATKLDEAIGWLRKGIELEPRSAQAHRNLGYALADQKKMDEAIASYRRAIDLDPTNASCHYHLGVALRGQKMLNEAITCFRKAIELKPSDFEAHTSLGTALTERKQWGDATACFRTAIKLNPSTWRAHNGLGNVLREQRELDEAIVCYRTAIELRPKDAMLHSNLGLALADQKKFEDAVACYRKALEFEPQYAQAHSNMAHALTAQGKTAEAIDAYRKAVELLPADGNLLNNLAWRLAMAEDVKLRRPAEAVALAWQAVRLDSKTWYRWNTLSIGCYRARSWQEALEAREQAIRLNDQGGAFSWNGLSLAMIRWQLGQKDEARQAYERVKEDAKKRAGNPDLARFLRETEELLDVSPVNPKVETEK